MSYVQGGQSYETGSSRCQSRHSLFACLLLRQWWRRSLDQILAPRLTNGGGTTISVCQGLQPLFRAIYFGFFIAAIFGMVVFSGLQRPGISRMGLTAFRNGMTENAQTKNTTAVLTNTHGTQARSLASRFDVPWDYVKPLRAKTPTESNNRYLYSPTAPSSTDGIGHAMAQVNAEITTALTLGITYTHRVSSFGSLTLDENSSAVEEFFG
jgi:hypothetical protein